MVKLAGKTKKIAIIGAGPIGCYSAELLAKQGRKVVVFEEHKKVGIPVQCTGIVTKDFFEIIKPRKEFIVNRLKKVKINSPNGSNTTIRSSDVVIDRTKLDNYLMQQAKKKGAKFFLGKKVIEIKEVMQEKIVRIKDGQGKTKIFKADIVVGCDGPNSIVGKHLGNRINSWIGIQARVKGIFDASCYEVFFGKEYPGFFGWIVPESKTTARIGIAAEKNPKKIFDAFMKKLNLNVKNIKEMQGGLIPRYDPKTVVEKDGIYIVGDAATQVKATTGGGLVPGLRAAEALAEAINNPIASYGVCWSDFWARKRSKLRGMNPKIRINNTRYRAELKRLNKELKKHRLIRNMLDRFTDKDYEKMIGYLRNPKIQELLKKESRDQASKIVWKAVIKEPRLLLLARVVFRAKRL